MNDLCADIGYKSINHYGEELCGDHVDVVETGDDSTVIVLSDGLGSGVKASILSTLTSKIISTMLAEGLSLEDFLEQVPGVGAATAATVGFSSRCGLFNLYHYPSQEQSDSRADSVRQSSCHYHS